MAKMRFGFGAMLSLCWAKTRRVHLGLGTKAQINQPFLGDVGAMLGLCRVYVDKYLWVLG